MKALSFLSARLDVSGLCLIATLAAGCSYDASQLRPLASRAPDGAVERPVGSDAVASGGGTIASSPDASISTGGNGGSTGTGGAGGMGATSGGNGGGGSSGLGGSGGRGDAGMPDASGAQPDVPIGGAGGSAGGIGGVGGTTSGGIGGGASTGLGGSGGRGDAGVPDAPGAQPDVPIGGTGGGFGVGGGTGVGGGGSSATGGGPGAGGTTNLGGTVTGGSATGGTTTSGTSTGGSTGGTGTGGTRIGGATAPMIISIDFVGGVPPSDSGTVVMAATESAGVKPATHWNSAASNTGTLSSLVLADGTSTSASIAYEASATWTLSWTDSPGNVRMMNGYLDPRATASPATINVTGLASPMSSGYDVYVYCFGHMPWAETRTARYTIGSTTHTVVQTEPPQVTSFSGYTLAPEAGAGNYVVFKNVTGTSFTLTATPASSTLGYVRAPVNGIQIVYPSGS